MVVAVAKDVAAAMEEEDDILCFFLLRRVFFHTDGLQCFQILLPSFRYDIGDWVFDLARKHGPGLLVQVRRLFLALDGDRSGILVCIFIGRQGRSLAQEQQGCQKACGNPLLSFLLHG